MHEVELAVHPAQAREVDHQAGERFSPTAANPTSSAFGFGQLILVNRRRYAPQVGADPADEGYHTGATDPCEQLRMMRLYIEDRYGSTKKAKKFWNHHRWY